MALKRVSEAGTYLMFVEEHLLKNELCIFGESVTKNWKARRLWLREGGRPDFDYLLKEFGHVEVPVADCTAEQFSSHPKTKMKFADFISYWKTVSTTCSDPPNTCTDVESSSPRQKTRLLYLKDWHFVREFPDYGAYTIPDFFRSDWLNEVWDVRRDVADDYRFVYMGPKGTWTPFHADVFRSYSWSANVCGRKEWLLYPPGEEDLLRSHLGTLPFDITSQELKDRRMFPNAGRACRPIRVIQGPGEVIFVPSGWHHQVRNLEDTISINHNWVNAFCLQHMWLHLKKELKLVQLEISDCKDMDGWEQQCQLILKTSAGIDYQEFFQFLCLITIPRLRDFETATKWTPSCSGSNVCFSELKQLTSKALTCQTFTFLGSCEQPAELVERLHVIHLAARDNLAAVIEGCGSFVSLSVDSEQFPLKGLFSELSEAVSAVVRQNIMEDSSGLCMTIRAFELQRIWSVMQELVGSVNFIH